jgi:4-azaleucine resistance transporter AzlC
MRIEVSPGRLNAGEARGTRARPEVWRGLRESLPVMIGFVPFALVFGAQASQKGLRAVEVPLMTGLNFAGGSEFAVIGLWTSPPHIILLAAVTFLVNSRHLLMGAALAPYIQHLPRRRALPALFFMCDESWAMGLADARRRAAAGVRDAFSIPYYLGAGIGMYLTWVVATAAGAALGPTFGNVEAYGFGMAFPAVFLVMLKGMWKGVRAARPWLVSLVVASVTHLVLPGAWFVAAGAVTGLASAYVWAGR